MDKAYIQRLLDFGSPRIVSIQSDSKVKYKLNFTNLSVDGKPVEDYVSCRHCKKVFSLCTDTKSNLYRHQKFHYKQADSELSEDRKPRPQNFSKSDINFLKRFKKHFKKRHSQSCKNSICRKRKSYIKGREDEIN